MARSLVILQGWWGTGTFTVLISSCLLDGKADQRRIIGDQVIWSVPLSGHAFGTEPSHACLTPAHHDKWAKCLTSLDAQFSYIHTCTILTTLSSQGFAPKVQRSSDLHVRSLIVAGCVQDSAAFAGCSSRHPGRCHCISVLVPYTYLWPCPAFLSHSFTEEFTKCSVVERRYCVQHDQVCNNGCTCLCSYLQYIINDISALTLSAYVRISA